MISEATITTGTNSRATDATTNTILTFTGTDGPLRLSIAIDAGSSRLIVRQANHDGAADKLTARVLDKLCTIIVGRPLQEAADHGAVYTVVALPNDCAPIKGIRTPHNAGPVFILAERLVRQVHAAARQHFNIEHRENAWYTRPSADWLSKDEAAQAASIKPVIASFLETNALHKDDIFISRIERGTRVTIAFSENVTYKMKPELMMKLERLLRCATNNPLELFMEEMKDANKIRRL